MNLLRKIVSGKRERLIESGYDLDLTYIVPRIIAMSFPASGMETTWRNSIEQVSQYLNERHSSNYQIYNLSGRKYNYEKFNNNVLNFKWEDHSSPPLSVLFQVCQRIIFFLQEKLENIVVIHCLAGKGRTGTAICCFLLYTGFFNSADEVMLYYQKKRFSSGGGVTQPSQIRYIYYFEQIMKNYQKTPILVTLDNIKISEIPNMKQKSNKGGCRPYVELYNVKDNQLMYSTKSVTHEEQDKYYSNPPKKAGENQTCTDKQWKIEMKFEKDIKFIGDIQFKFKHNGKFSQQKMFRTSFNTAFLDDNLQVKLQIKDLDPFEVIKSDKIPKNIEILFTFKNQCDCTITTPFSNKCQKCFPHMDTQIVEWSAIYAVMKSYEEFYNKDQAIYYLFGDPYFNDINEVFYSQGLLLSNKNLQKKKEKEKQGQINQKPGELSLSIIKKINTL